MNKYDRIFKTAIDAYGERAQISQAVEELLELATVLTKYLNKPPERQVSISAILDEVADVKVMTRQLEIIFDPASQECFRDIGGITGITAKVKIARLIERMTVDGIPGEMLYLDD